MDQINFQFAWNVSNLSKLDSLLLKIKHCKQEGVGTIVDFK